MTAPATPPIRWDEWKPALRVTHIDPSCQTCEFPGPLMMRHGKTLQPGKRVRKVTVRSKVTEGIRPEATTTWVPGYWALTHVAFLCPRCDEELVYGYSMTSPGELVEMPELGRPARFTQEVLPFPTSGEKS